MTGRSDGPTAAAVWSVVVTYNAAHVVARCLDSLVASESSTNMVVVDNGSADETVHVVRSRFPNVTIVQIGANIGFGAACNAGAELAMRRGADYIFFLNPDAFVLPSCVGRLVAALQREERLAIVSPLLVDYDTKTVRYAGANLDMRTLAFSVRGWGEAPGDVAYSFEETGRPTGAAMLARRAPLEDVGLMDPSYFLYWEETEWALRLGRAGYSIGFEPDAVAYHESSHSTGGAGSSVLEYYFARNLLRMVRDNRALGTLATSRRVAPQLVQRVLDRVHAREPRAALRTAQSVCLAYLDFWRSRTGPRRSTTPTVKQ